MTTDPAVHRVSGARVRDRGRHPDRVPARTPLRTRGGR